MIFKLRPYPAYRDSRIPWLGKVPAHWEVLPFKRYFRVAMGQTILASDIQDNGKYPVFSATEGNVYFGRISSPRFVLLPGDLVIPARGVSIGSVKLVFEPCVCTQTTIYEKKMAGANIDSNYVFYYLYGCRRWLFEYDRTAIPQLTVDQVRNNQLLVPYFSEQTAIVRFLDYVDRRIRRVIRARQRRIKLLEEYKQALIHRAVTGQIDVRTGQPYPDYKDSGVEWLGKVPAHWEILPLKWLAKRYKNGATPSTSNDSYYKEGIIHWYSPSSFGSGEIVSTPVRFISNIAIEEGAARLIHGPALLVVVIGASAGKMILMEQNGTTNQQITAFELPYDWITCLFLLRQLSLGELWLRETASTATIPILSTNIVTHLPCLMPPPEERYAIVEYLNALISKIDTVIVASHREIELLQEYRERLIADVVTGKLDVREVAAQLPEEPPEEIDLMDEDELAESKEENREEGDDLTEEISEEDDR